MRSKLKKPQDTLVSPQPSPSPSLDQETKKYQAKFARAMKMSKEEGKKGDEEELKQLKEAINESFKRR